MSWNLSLKLNNLSNYVYSLFPTSSALRINNINTVSPGDTLTITGGTIALNGTTSIGTGNITTANITTANTTTANTTTQYLTNLGSTVSNGATINLTVPTASTANLALGILDFSTYVSMKATSASSVLISLTVPSLPNGFLANGQSITVSGVGAPWNGVYTVIYGGGITTSSNTYTLNNPSGIATGTTTTTLGTISYLNSTSNTALGTISSNGLTITNATINTSLISNSIASKATTALTLNSNNTGSLGEIILQKGGTTYGTIQNANASYNLQLMSESGMSLDTKANGNINIGANGTGSINFFTNSVLRASLTANGIVTTKYANAGNNNVFLEAFYAGANPALICNAGSYDNINAVGRYMTINQSGIGFYDGKSTGETLRCGVNSTGFYVPSAGYFLNGASANTAFGTSYATNDIIIYNNAGGSISFNNQTNLYSNCLYRAGRASIYYRPDEINYWSVSVNSISAFYISQAGGYSYYLSGGQTNANWNWSSDERLKTNIQLAPSFLETVLSIPVKTYNYTKNPDVLCVGYIAQDLKKLPQLIDVVSETPDLAPDGTPYLGISGGSLLPYLIKAFQEQNELIVNQQKQIDELKLLVEKLLNK